MDFDVLFQDFEGEITALAGQTCEQFYCVQVRRDNGDLSPCFFWLKIREGVWHRFFIDRISVLHWHAYSNLDSDDLTDEDLHVLDMAVSYGLQGLAIRCIAMEQISTTEGCLTITFTGNRICMVDHVVDTELRDERMHLTIV